MLKEKPYLALFSCGIQIFLGGDSISKNLSQISLVQSMYPNIDILPHPKPESNTSQGTWHYIKTLSSRNRHDARLRWCREPEQRAPRCLGITRFTKDAFIRIQQMIIFDCSWDKATLNGCFFYRTFTSGYWPPSLCSMSSQVLVKEFTF